jgi:two-component system, OmpR family, phosphate regulon sensor histidine kinase PhoR
MGLKHAIMPAKVNNTDTHLKIIGSLKTGILVFEAGELQEINEAAKKLLNAQETEQRLGAYTDSINSLLKTNEDNYTKQLTGIIGKPLNGTLHLLNNLQIIEISESYETKLGEASHELRRPLTNVKTLVDTLHLWGAAEDPLARKKFLGQLHHEVERLNKLVNELLDLSRLQAGSIPINFQQIALKAMVQDCFNLLEEQAAKNNIKLINEVPDNFVLIGDLDKLNHVVQNLIENGIRYNRPDGSVRVKPVKGKNSFAVQDTGYGIMPANIPFIFERFKRFNKDVPGTGLGLAIVKSIVDLHGGKIEVKSEPDKGTEFIVSIPPKKIALPTLS